ncbi:transglycosylase domain-containing protein [Sediminibacillus massiliensis]|uniref:transglycosylase domain-containing protein n=1 Tax=Sediminibacillus massiliensis TaxID=1926277 RepID=UPI00098853A4|nr:PBP1A family penicillin-binding protein [Sediminibacillus massiliensis]
MEKIKSYYQKFKWPLVALGLSLLLGLIGYATIVFGGRFVVDDKDLILPAATVLETKDGKEVGEIYTENRDLVAIDDIPDHVEDAFLAIEDNRFYQHAGVDFKSVMRAVYRDIVTMQKAEGGSTITQQLAKNLFLHNEKTWMRKTKEVMAAIHLERNYSKQKILEFYLNEIYFAHGVYGIGAASEYYFNKHVSDLTVSEGAMLAALSKAPNTYSPINNPEKAKERRDLVLQQMERLGMIETEEMLQLQGKTLGVNHEEPEDTPWLDSYIDLVIKEAGDEHQLSLDELKRGGYRIIVNVDEQAQKIAYDAFQEDTYFPGSASGTEGSYVLMEQKSGKIVTALGGRHYEIGSMSRLFVNKQPGSVMKPIAVYGPALMLEKYQPYTMLTDEKQSYGDYTATNLDGNYSGKASMYQALKESKNAPAVWLLNEIGIPYSKEYLSKMGINLPDDGLAIALGGLKEGLTPIQLAEAYSAFVHEGDMVNGYAIERIVDRDGKTVFQAEPESANIYSPQVAWNILRMLEGVVDEGTGSAGDYDKALAGKTGSTQHPFAEGKVKDAWFVGFTPEYVSSMWMGYDQVDEQHYLTAGSKAPTILTKAILSELDKYQDLSAQFDKPVNVEELPEPVQMPVITDLSSQFKFGGFSLVKGQLDWTPAGDERVIYHVYRVQSGKDEKIGETEGEGTFQINRVNPFKETEFYVVPYNPLTGQEGAPSNRTTLSF